MTTKKPNLRPKRPSLHTPYEERTYPKLSAAEQHCSAYRLSKVPQKFNTNKALELEKNESFIEEYFRKNPEELDKSPPEEKMARIMHELQDENLDEQRRCKLLIQNKTLNLIKYGENSYESLRCYAQLGFCYNRLSKPAGAIRNLERAHQLEEIIDIPRLESIEIAIETAEAHLMICGSHKTKGGSDIRRHCNEANKALRPYYDAEISDQRLSFRRDLAHARILNVQEKFRVAIDSYNKAVDSYQAAFPDLNVTPDFANMCVEAAENAESAESISSGGNFERRTKFYYYKKAFEFFLDLEMWEDAEKIRPKLPKEGEYEEEEGEIQSKQDVEENQKTEICEDDSYIGGRLTEAITAKPEQEEGDREGSSSDSHPTSEHAKSPANSAPRKSPSGSVESRDDDSFKDPTEDSSFKERNENSAAEGTEKSVHGKSSSSNHEDSGFGSDSSSESSRKGDEFEDKKEPEVPEQQPSEQKERELSDVFSDLESHKSDEPQSPLPKSGLESGRTQGSDTPRSNFGSKPDSSLGHSTKQSTDDFENASDFENTDKASETSGAAGSTKSDHDATAHSSKFESDHWSSAKPKDDTDDFMSDF